MIFSILSVLGGLAALAVGGEVLVRGAVGVARKTGLQPLLIGLVVIGFGTSMPELVTSVQAARAGSPNIAWGNIVGSNIANSLLVLGMAATVTPIILNGKGTRRDPLVVLTASALFAVLAWTGAEHWLLGIALLALLASYILARYVMERSDDTAPVENETANPTPQGWSKPLVETILGLAALLIGGHILVSGSIELAGALGMSETLIGLTVVAIGTSLPELVTSIIAAWRGQSGVALGNVLGSNLYNILGIGGMTMALAPSAIPRSMVSIDIPLVLLSALTIALLCTFAKGMGRILGAFFTALYFGYLALLVVTA
ncbi:sodium:calcium antiporter [Altericroceibacterium spongiae]|uniref:Sodium:calcium antiporter n=1 Tax=Altericroceibacterium spongiae TaxID=2320269 RepID=A0A420EIT7_9SPHN|nr:calcium/sodium antiporter [Altericroceibacterium spongiae]RKF20642.1 sodium:calcium antiporter [Altericroceibacterium spongiae]